MTDMSNNAVGVVDELCELYLNLDRLKIEGEFTNRGVFYLILSFKNLSIGTIAAAVGPD